MAPLTVQRHVQDPVLRELSLRFPLNPPTVPSVAEKAERRERERERERDFDPAAYEWQKPREGRRTGSRPEESRAINLSHEHVPLTSGLATLG
jgi:hypothetical protein